VLLPFTALLKAFRWSAIALGGECRGRAAGRDAGRRPGPQARAGQGTATALLRVGASGGGLRAGWRARCAGQDGGRGGVAGVTPIDLREIRQLGRW